MCINFICDDWEFVLTSNIKYILQMRFGEDGAAWIGRIVHHNTSTIIIYLRF